MPIYDDHLKAEQLLMLTGAIDSFLDSYGRHRGRGDQRTLIFLPGGMGSELTRATRRFDGTSPNGSYTYETLWVDLKKIFLDQGALLLQMKGNEDSNDQFIVANGPLRNCALHPYEGLIRWCTANQIDLLMVGWDFRRNAAWNVDFLFQTLFPEVRQRAQVRGWSEDPLAGATLVGHSFGGMIVKWMLNKHDDPFCQQLRLAVTVGTPFYGSPGQTERLFVSEPALGPFYDLDEVTKVIATLPGGFSLFFLDSQTYDSNQTALAADAEFPLDRYPSFDSVDRTVRVDPYMSQPNHPTNPRLCRYPLREWPWFQSYLANGLQEYRAVASPLHPSMQAKLHNVRGIQMAGGQPASATKVMQQWGWYDVTKPRMPQARTALTTFGGPGDGVIPAWSARLVTQPASQVHTVRGAADGDGHLEHMTLMDFPDVRSVLLQLMRPDALENIVVASGPAPATREEFTKLTRHIEGLASLAMAAAPYKAAEDHLDSLGVRQTHALALRWLIELHKGYPPLAPPPSLT